ncbi:hypothetical protein [Streptomyces sp. DHE17-7]|uniref:hypothetical protein n=1 Tax=Streptomyces sp. DHE17-7 TaxID=2759949 RepID=UPI0022EAA622|nr:hypothetical protein [Streptomyces sp. DHE17-7]MBJ6623507.1 hypothetical protein [Streptomyces sp. DHE17-7]
MGRRTVMAGHVHTAANAVPPLDDTELGGLLDDLAGIHPGIDLIRDGLRLLALDRHTTDKTQTLIATLAGASDGTNTVSAIGLLIARLADPDTNPALRTLPLGQQKNAQIAGQAACFALTDPDLHQTASETSAAIDGT